MIATITETHDKAWLVIGPYCGRYATLVAAIWPALNLRLRGKQVTIKVVAQSQYGRDAKESAERVWGVL